MTNVEVESFGQPSWLAEYQAITGQVGFVDWSRRTSIELQGEDRAKFLHGLCTNDIQRLEPYDGCEAFLLSAQGKTLGHVFVFSDPQRLILETVAGQGPTLLAHLDRYLIREQVVLVDRAAEFAEILLAGPQACATIERLTGESPPRNLQSRQATLAGAAAWLRKVRIVSDGDVIVEVERDKLSQTTAALPAAGIPEASEPAFEAARIEARFPLYGQDIGDHNLPQEVARDADALNFRKGCYLGQETVARIDALGHVNQLLVVVRFAGTTIPPVGAVLMAGDREAGRVTSAAYSPRLATPLALAFVRRQFAPPGTRLTWEGTAAETTTPPG